MCFAMKHPKTTFISTNGNGINSTDCNQSRIGYSSLNSVCFDGNGGGGAGGMGVYRIYFEDSKCIIFDLISFKSFLVWHDLWRKFRCAIIVTVTCDNMVEVGSEEGRPQWCVCVSYGVAF